MDILKEDSSLLSQIQKTLRKILRIKQTPTVSKKNKMVKAYIFGFNEIVPAMSKITHLPEIENEIIVGKK